jgi:hypothetical protein
MEKRIQIPPPRRTKLRGENRHRIAVVAPTGFEPVFPIHHALINSFGKFCT